MTLLNKQQVRAIVQSAAAAAKNGEITTSQFRRITALGMVTEIRASLKQKSARYNRKYLQSSKSR
jgi:hypothetical protein